MPGFVVTTANLALCSHGGQCRPTVASPSVRVMGQPIALQMPVYVIAGCPHQTPVPSPMPCLSGLWTTGAKRVRSRGMPILLTDAKGVTVPNGVTMTITPVPNRVKAQ